MKRFLLLSMAGIFIIFGFVSCKHSSKEVNSNLNYTQNCLEFIQDIAGDKV